MKSRNNLVFAIGIFVVLVGLVVTSPLLANKINADILSELKESPELLSNADFSRDVYLNDSLWTRISDQGFEIPKVEEGKLVLKGSDPSNLILAQRFPLSKDKKYRILIDYEKIGIPTGTFQISFGQNPLVGDIFSENIESDSYNKVFVPNISSAGSFFRINLQQFVGEIRISRISIIEVPEGYIEKTQTKTVEQSSSPTLTAMTQTPTPSATQSIVQTPTASPAITTPVAQEITGQKISLSIPPGWSYINPIRSVSTIYTRNNLQVFQMLGSKWISRKAYAKNSFIINEQGVLFVFNPAKEINIEIEEVKDTPSINIGPGWNMISNSSSESRNLSSISVGSENLFELISLKKAASSGYLIENPKNIFSMRSIDFTSNNVPPRTPFWFYIFEL